MSRWTGISVRDVVFVLRFVQSSCTSGWKRLTTPSQRRRRFLLGNRIASNAMSVKLSVLQAIRIVYGPTGRLTYLVAYLFFVQTIGGIIYGVVFGPSLGLQSLFYVGWVTLVVALFFFCSLIVYFRKEGKPGEGKSLMNTTVLVESGTYGIVRHPYILGSILMMCAAILISQHWLAAIVGVPVSACFYSGAVEEEEGLMVKFGDDYKRYMEKVPRMNFVLGIVRFLRRRKS